MKKYLVIAALGAAFLYSCQVQELPEKSAETEKTIPAHFVTDKIETKTYFGEAVTTSEGGREYPVFWSQNDNTIAISLNLNGQKEASANPAEDGLSATFDAEFTEAEATAPYVFYALSPYSAAISASVSHNGYHLNIPTEQTPIATSCDESAQIIAASKIADSLEEFGEIYLEFSHVTAYGLLTLRNIQLKEGDSVQSIDLTSSQPFAGEFFYNFDAASLEEAASSRTISILPENLTVTSDGTIENIWFACAPADLGGGSLKVQVNTAFGKFTRTIEIGADKLAFKPGRVSKFAVYMSSAEFEEPQDRWVLVTDASTLQADDQVIIASSATPGAAYAVSTTQTTSGNTPYRSGAYVTITQDADGQYIISALSDAVEKFTLKKESESGYSVSASETFFFQDASNHRYLFTSTNNNTNGLNSDSESTALKESNRPFASFKLTGSSDNITIIATTGTVGRNNNNYRQIRISTQDNTFRSYTSTSQTTPSTTNNTGNVYLYRLEAGIHTSTDPILEYSEYGAYLSSGNHIYGPGSQLSREYENGTLSFAIITPETYEVAEFNNIPSDPAAGDTFTLNYNVITGRKSTETDYNVTVVKVDGPKVWLSAGDGYGFIVKK